MEFIQNNNGRRGNFVAIEQGKQAGIITYIWKGDDEIIIEHTEVNDEFKGKGIAKKLVMAAVNYPRTNNIFIIQVCPFVKAMFDKTEAIRDVLAS
ncbi:GNAT family N-acetyltransferase [Flavobacterium sp. TMP13]|uniref:GNAT family N-acetyltransferase n=1 Tax=unclassified Flavobacterium TaxID=196869 RepID=UPI00076D6B96|nr:GNAT family N-acetyltransferase [Flavobacterium sp. TAB 87]KVV15862.1 hypothetical protein AP058_00702 [Flavobacterium sp. TAB 87]